MIAIARSKSTTNLARLVEEFNKLLAETRYAEAEVIAKQAREIAPDHEVVQNLVWKSTFVKRIQEQMQISEQKEHGFYDVLTQVEKSGIPFNDNTPYIHGDAKRWADLTASRRKLMLRQQNRLSPAGIEIQKSLEKKVDVNFTETTSRCRRGHTRSHGWC